MECRRSDGSPSSSTPVVTWDERSSLPGQTIHEAHAVVEELYPIEPDPDALARLRACHPDVGGLAAAALKSKLGCL